jgi:CheY-like chemotaxis protein
MIRILLIDDEKDILFNLKELLELVGYEVTIAFAGNEGLQYLAESDVHIIVCDMNMPKMCGIQFMKMITKNKRFATVPIIFHSANLAEVERLQLERMGAAGFLEKGMPFEKLNNKILEILANSNHLTKKGWLGNQKASPIYT